MGIVWHPLTLSQISASLIARAFLSQASSNLFIISFHLWNLSLVFILCVAKSTNLITSSEYHNCFNSSKQYPGIKVCISFFIDSLITKDIIAFREKDGYVVTHRIVSVFKNGDNVYFITKGDNNNTNDNGMVKSNRVEGKYVTKINGFGNVLLVLQKPITLIVILIIIVLIGIIWIGFDKNKLNEEERKELEKLRKEKNRKKSK